MENSETSKEFIWKKKSVHVDIHMGKIRERELCPHGSLNQFYEAFLLGFL